MRSFAIGAVIQHFTKSLNRVPDVVPADDGLGSPGDRRFNNPPPVEAASTPPFFREVKRIDAAPPATADWISIETAPAP